MARDAGAAVERFAILIGNNVGERDDPSLRFAESDAIELREVLADVGGVPAENIVLLQGTDVNAARRAIITVNDRIRTLPAGTEAMLVVYYSGHADASALHMADTRFELDELQRLVRGSSAAVRLLVVDACRSGALTRVKGGRRVEPFDIQIDDRLASQGAVFLTSSAANEDAQESDELKGSFFTHYLISGLLGAADLSGDGVVTLAEAYRYAYDNTLRATSRTLAGSQHPTFEFDMSGRGDVVLTSLVGSQRGWLQFPDDRAYLVLRGDEDGAVIAEVGNRDRRRRLSLRPGRYFVRGRGRDFLLEGIVDVASGRDHAVVDDELHRIAYARLVRKGRGVLAKVSGPELGFAARSAIPNSMTSCLGAFAGYQVEYPSFDIGARAGWCRATSRTDALSADVDELALSVRVAKVWDIGPVALGPMMTAGGGTFDQRFDTTGVAPSRLSAFGHLAAGLAIGSELPWRAHATVELGTDTFLFRQDQSGARLALSTGVRLALALRWRL
jgi:hypothetical protein